MTSPSPALARRKSGWLALLILAVGMAAAPTQGAEPAYLKVANNSIGSTQHLELQVNKSMIIDLPVAAGEVIASQPSVATVVMRTKTRAIVQGVAGGDTNIFFMDTKGNNITVLDLKVFQPRSDVGNALEAAIARNIPGSAIKVESVLLGDSTNRVVLTGTAISQDDLARATQIAVQFAGSAENVANIVTISGNQQVKLKVTVAEINRETVKQMGINLDGQISVGPVSASFANTPALGGATGVTTNNGPTVGFDNGAGISLEAQLKALERQGAVRTLAEPTLTATSGTEASFLAGGEFPVPTEIDNDGNITYTFKEFGVKLTFTPTVKSNGLLGLAVDTEVSELTTEGGFTVGPITIQATKKRSAKTTVEMRPGQSLAIGGMLQDKIRQQINQLPGLGNVPILGALFRSRDFIHAQTELVIVVTPYMDAPSSTQPELPTDSYVVAGDAEAIFLGHLENMYAVSGGGDLRGSYQGSVGFVLD
ncbi:MAG: type II and III secretion system protein family protein [Devosia sp.]